MITPDQLRDLFVSFPTGVTIVTATDASGQATGLTAGSFAGVSLDPPLMGLSISNASHTLEVLQARGSYGVHILGDWQADLARQLSRDLRDKLADVDYRLDARNVPCIGDCLRSLTCDVEAVLPGGDHSVLLGRIVELNPFGYDRPIGSPLIFHQRGYFRLGVSTDAVE